MIVYLAGRSGVGKDTIYRELKNKCNFKEIILHTTRPMRDGEENGREYFFDSYEDLMKLDILEMRTYHTASGDWHYATVNDFELNKYNYIGIGTLESYEKLVERFGKDNVKLILITVDKGELLTRALRREMEQSKPNYAEMCRRFLADEIDYSDERINKLKIDKVYINDNVERVVNEILDDIRKEGKMHV